MSGYGDFWSNSRSVLSASSIGGLGLVDIGVRVREVIQPVTRRDNKVGRGVLWVRAVSNNKKTQTENAGLSYSPRPSCAAQTAEWFA